MKRLWIAALLLPCSMVAAPTRAENFEKIVDRPVYLLRPLIRARLAQNIPAVLDRLPATLLEAAIEVAPAPVSGQLRIGAKLVPVAGQVWWKHFEGPGQRPWIDVIEFPNAQACRDVFDKGRQPHTGMTDPTYFSFFTVLVKNGLDAVGAVARKDRYLFNFGVAIPFRIRSVGEEPNSSEELTRIGESIEILSAMIESVDRLLIDPAFVVWIPKAKTDSEEQRMLRVAGFARLWSEVKYNFVFLNERPDLDWESVLELYLPQVAATRNRQEYVNVLRRVVALLKDGHTNVQDSSKDRPLLNIEPVEGRPVVIDVADTPEIQRAGIRPGMEVVSVGGMAVAEALEKRIYPYVAASTPQGRDLAAFYELLAAEPDTRVTAEFRDLAGNTVSADLPCNMNSNFELAKWRSRPSFEFRELPGEIAYVALNSFGSDRVVKSFDERFERVLASKGLVIDVRNNGGGSSNIGYAIVARLIESATDQTSKWRTRVHNPTFRAWGKAPEWFEGDHSTIQPRGDKPYRGPVAVLIGPKTFSAAEDFLAPLKATRRATLVGSPTGGSTGQPMFADLNGVGVRICTKWDRFADGTEFVGVGVQPDIRLERTRRDVAEGLDPVLEKALAVVRR